MKIFDCFQNPQPIGSADYCVYREDGTEVTAAAALQRQHSVSILVDGTVAYTLVCTPEHLVELALGRLFSDGVIGSRDDVESVHVCKQGDVVRVALTGRASAAFEATKGRPAPSHISTCNTVREAHVALTSDKVLPPVTPLPFPRPWVFDLAHEFAQDTPMHKRTRGAHSCFLAQGGSVLFFCEDLGRHNAFDKAVGWALRHNVDLGRCFAITSGRVPTDMATKAIRAGIPVLLSASVPTDQTVELARQKGLTLIGQIKDGQVAVFHDPTGSMSRRTAVVRPQRAARAS